MRIVQISHYALPHIGGIEVVVDQLARALRSRGHEVTHIASAAGRDEGAPAWNILETTFGIPLPIFAPSSLRIMLWRAIIDADVVHAHGMLYGSSRLALALAKRRGIARVLTEHVGFVPYGSSIINAIERAAIATLGRRAAARAQTIVTLNPSVAEQMK